MVLLPLRPSRLLVFLFPLGLDRATEEVSTHRAAREEAERKKRRLSEIRAG